DEAEPTLRDRLRIQAVGIAFHERHTGHADDVGFAAGEREDTLSAAADHDRWVWPLHRPWPTRVPAHLNEVARIVQFFALPVRLDEGDDLGQLGDSPTRTVEVESHRGVLDFAPAGADPHFQTTIGEQIECRRFLGQYRRHVIIDAEHSAPDV